MLKRHPGPGPHSNGQRAFGDHLAGIAAGDANPQNLAVFRFYFRSFLCRKPPGQTRQIRLYHGISDICASGPGDAAFWKHIQMCLEMSAGLKVSAIPGVLQSVHGYLVSCLAFKLKPEGREIES
jgi:hypothetical protein